MPPNVEQLLLDAGFKYTKEVTEAGDANFSLPFDTGNGPVVVQILANGVFLSPYVFVRDLDSIGLAGRRKDFLRRLLELNTASAFARVAIWTEPESEEDWIIVAGYVPMAGITDTSVHQVMAETVNLVSTVQDTILLHSADPQRELTNSQGPM